MLTAEQYQEYRARYDAYHTWRGNRSSISAAERESAPQGTTNEETSAIEVYEFMQDKPTRYTAYLKENESSFTRGSFTTWTGETLGSLHIWKRTRDGFGNKVWYVSAVGINGVKYHGRHYPDSGDLVYLTANKHHQ